MTVRRIMGLENEYGILAFPEDETEEAVQAAKKVDARQASELIVRSYMNAGPGRGTSMRPVVWDYGGEDPLNDSRGHRLDREEADESMRTDEDEDGVVVSRQWKEPEGFKRRASYELMLGGKTESLRPPEEADLLIKGIPNVVLTNGARLYVDHSHPEYAGPECYSPREAVLYDRAGDRVMQHAMTTLEQTAGRPNVVTYKNNVDGKGQTYGCHDNYTIRRDVPFADLVDVLTVHFATRPILCGTGRVGIGQKSEEDGFQISQRADYVESHIALQTTYDRPLINTRDEPHADSKYWRRLHVIQGDATSFDVSTFLKLGTTSLVLWMLDSTKDEKLGEAAREAAARVGALAPTDPIKAVQHYSHDLTMKVPFPTAAGGEVSALEAQQEILDAVRGLLAEAEKVTGVETDAETREVVERWEAVLNGLATDLASVAGQVEWVAKYLLLNRLRERAGGSWLDPRVIAADLQWHDMRPAHSLARKLEAAGRVERMFTDEEIEHAEVYAPRSTRAYIRGEVLRRYPNGVSSASWGSLVLELPGRFYVIRVPLYNPQDGTAEQMEALLDESPMVDDFLDRIIIGGDPERVEVVVDEDEEQALVDAEEAVGTAAAEDTE